jgi:hypothetical protein
MACCSSRDLTTVSTGRDVFNWGGTEFVIQELHIDPLIHWCIEPQLVGNERRWDITFDSGPYTMQGPGGADRYGPGGSYIASSTRRDAAPAAPAD